ncbi:MAG TPA: hypothetical protein VFQ78_13470 [Candidatus Udaeobacter sp.]|jgi:hypothetical protein|nr:hypothetical protein [Candidatus Udaeobacter sp.]
MSATTASPLPSEKAAPGRLYLTVLIAVLSVGLFLRLPAYIFRGDAAPLHFAEAIHLQPMFSGIGFDEALYRNYLNGLIHEGLGNYCFVVDRYIDVQKGLPGSILPPVRFLFIFAGYVWHLLFRSEALVALHNVASLFSILTLLLSAFFAWRLKGPAFALGVAALMTFAPTQLHMSQHALVDGFFTFWALLVLFLLWENLQAPGKPSLAATYLVTLSCLIVTKENSFFVWVALLTIILSNRWLKFGTVTKELWLATFLGPLLGVVILICLAGGLTTLIATYQLSVSKNYTLAFAILTGDGPWHRYLVDLFLVSPIIVILAATTIVRLDRTRKPELFLTLFIAASYIVMCNVKYGMNLRYANMWDMPLRFLAVSQLLLLCSAMIRHRTTIVALSIALLCAYEFRQSVILLARYPMHELVTDGLLRSQHIIKGPAR